MVCDSCGEPAFAIAPGTEPTRELFVLNSGEPMRRWCLKHWLERFGAYEKLQARP